MKKLIASFSFIALLASCAEQPIKTQNTYAIDWDNNQIEPFAKLSILREGKMVTILETTSRHFECALRPNEIVMIGITPKTSTPRPYCYLRISKRGDFDPTTGVYKPDAFKVLYEQRTETNSLGYNGLVLTNGDLK